MCLRHLHPLVCLLKIIKTILKNLCHGKFFKESTILEILFLEIKKYVVIYFTIEYKFILLVLKKIYMKKILSNLFF